MSLYRRYSTEEYFSLKSSFGMRYLLIDTQWLEKNPKIAKIIYFLTYVLPHYTINSIKPNNINLCIHKNNCFDKIYM